MIVDSPREFLENNENLPPRVRLEHLVAVLRGPGGCPWDQRQTALSIIDFVIDEAHELKEALQKGDAEEIVGEFGDLAFTFTFLEQTLAPRVSRAAAVDSVVKKMIARHPHVFAKGEAEGQITEGEIKRRWESLKTAENPARTDRRMDRDLPASLPAWKKAAKILTRARNAGFRYPSVEAAWDKVAEEWSELCQALEQPEVQQREAELGDLLLALATAAMEEGIDAESALVKASTRLSDRLEAMEKLAGRPLSEIPYQELSEWYARAHGTQEKVCFNYCGVSPWPGAVKRAVASASGKLAREGLAGTLALREEREKLRDQLRSFVKAEPSTSVVFLPNISAVALGVAYSLDWRKGDRILLGSQEFPANTVPWKMAAKTFQLEIVEFDEDRLRREPERAWSDLEAMLRAIRPRLVALSSVSFWSGFRLDSERLTSLCHRHQALLFLDAVQALGTVPFSMGQADFVAGGSHKGMLSPEGAGFLLVSPRAASGWVPRMGSWLSLPDPVDFLTRGEPALNPNEKVPRVGDPTVLEGGSLNTLGYAGLAASLAFLQEAGVSKIFEHIQALQDPLDQGMVGLGFRGLRSSASAGRSALLCYDPPEGCDLLQLAARLSQEGIQAGIPRGRLRFGLHLMTTKPEVERLLEVMEKALP